VFCWDCASAVILLVYLFSNDIVPSFSLLLLLLLLLLPFHKISPFLLCMMWNSPTGQAFQRL